MIAQPPYGERWLQIEAIEPEPSAAASTLSAEPTFLVRFNQYIQEDSFPSYGVISLATGGRGVSGTLEPVMSERALLWRPRGELRDGFEYTLRVDATSLQSVTGAPTPPDAISELVFRVDASLAPEQPLPQESTGSAPARWAHVREVFEARGCYTCHGESSWMRLNALEYEDLIGIRAADMEIDLVRFKDPARSYLMHKILPDYPVRRGTVQPPPWAVAQDARLSALSAEEIALVERWIRAGSAR